MSIAEHEVATYEQAWAMPQYAEHSPGEVRLPIFLDMIRVPKSRRFSLSVLDAGCGAGKGALALIDAGFTRVKLCDHTEAGLAEAVQHLPFYRLSLWDDLRPVVGSFLGGRVDYVYCCDVLEHIPPEFTMLVVQRLLDVSRYGLFVSISLVPDAFGAFVGKPLHQTVTNFEWWRDRFNELGRVLEGRDLLTTAVFLVARKDAPKNPLAGRC